MILWPTNVSNAMPISTSIETKMPVSQCQMESSTVMSIYQKLFVDNVRLDSTYSPINVFLSLCLSLVVLLTQIQSLVLLVMLLSFFMITNVWKRKYNVWPMPVQLNANHVLLSMPSSLKMDWEFVRHIQSLITVQPTQPLLQLLAWSVIVISIYRTILVLPLLPVIRLRDVFLMPPKILAQFVTVEEYWNSTRNFVLLLLSLIQLPHVLNYKKVNLIVFIANLDIFLIVLVLVYMIVLGLLDAWLWKRMGLVVISACLVSIWISSIIVFLTDK